jgi:putative flippase GtrA
MAGDDANPVPPPRRPAIHHWTGFLVSGLIALSVDASILETGIRLFGLHPLVARLLGISCAMVAGWLAHRTLTFMLRSRPTVGEFARYAAVAWTTQAINYGTFACILIVRPALPPFVALILASLVATIFAYVGMRYGAFRGRQ